MGQFVSSCSGVCQGGPRSAVHEEVAPDRTLQADREVVWRSASRQEVAPHPWEWNGLTPATADEGNGGSSATPLCSEGVEVPGQLPTLLGNRSLAIARGLEQEKDAAKFPHASHLLTLRRVFAKCDRDGNGLIDKRELIKTCQENDDVARFFGLPHTIRQEDGSRSAMLESLFQGIDSDDDRHISFQELWDWHRNKATGLQRACGQGGSHSSAPNGGARGAAHEPLGPVEAPALLTAGVSVEGTGDHGGEAPPPAPAPSSGGDVITAGLDEATKDCEPPAPPAGDRGREGHAAAKCGCAPRHAGREIRHVVYNLAVIAEPGAEQLTVAAAAAAEPSPRRSPATPPASGRPPPILVPLAPSALAASASAVGAAPREGGGAAVPLQSPRESREAPALDRAELKAQRRAAKKELRKASRQDAKVHLRPWLDRHGFPDVKSPTRATWLRLVHPLHVAVRENDAELVRLLDTAGASVTEVDSWGRTPLQLAHRLNGAGSHLEVVAILQQAADRKARHRAKAERRGLARAGTDDGTEDGALCVPRRSFESAGAIARSGTETTGAAVCSSTASSSCDPAPLPPRSPSNLVGTRR